MAANDYYQTLDPGRQPLRQDNDISPSPSASASHSSGRPPNSIVTNTQYQAYQPNQSSYAPSPYSTTASFDTHQDTLRPSRDSYYNTAYGGAAHDDRQYADDIPLKQSQSRPFSHHDSFAQNAQYPPSPESQHPPKSTQRPRKKQGWFKGRITWVVYLATIVQIGVFIAEIVVNCKSDQS